MKPAIAILITLSFLLVGCTSNEALYDGLEPNIEYYDVNYRQLPHEETYSRLSYSHLPKPIQSRGRLKAPLLQPLISFELPKSNLKEALEAVSQTIGYEARYPANVGERPISVNRVATVEEVLAELEQQAMVKTELDHDSRVIRVVDGSTHPSLPMVRDAVRN